MKKTKKQKNNNLNIWFTIAVPFCFLIGLLIWKAYQDNQLAKNLKKQEGTPEIRKMELQDQEADVYFSEEEDLEVGQSHEIGLILDTNSSDKKIHSFEFVIQTSGVLEDIKTDDVKGLDIGDSEAQFQKALSSQKDVNEIRVAYISVGDFQQLPSRITVRIEVQANNPGQGQIALSCDGEYNCLVNGPNSEAQTCYDYSYPLNIQAGEYNFIESTPEPTVVPTIEPTVIPTAVPTTAPTVKPRRTPPPLQGQKCQALGGRCMSFNLPFSERDYPCDVISGMDCPAGQVCCCMSEKCRSDKPKESWRPIPVKPAIPVNPKPF